MNDEVKINEEELVAAIEPQVKLYAAVPAGASWETYYNGQRIGFRMVDPSGTSYRGFAVEADVHAVATSLEAVVVDVISRRFVEALENGLPEQDADGRYSVAVVTIP